MWTIIQQKYQTPSMASINLSSGSLGNPLSRTAWIRSSLVTGDGSVVMIPFSGAFLS